MIKALPCYIPLLNKSLFFNNNDIIQIIILKQNIKGLFKKKKVNILVYLFIYFLEIQHYSFTFRYLKNNSFFIFISIILNTL